MMIYMEEQVTINFMAVLGLIGWKEKVEMITWKDILELTIYMEEKTMII